MRKLTWVVVLAVAVISGVGAQADDARPSLPNVVEQVLPSVVKLSATDSTKDDSFGSGVIIDAKGAILTNDHVVKKMASVRVRFQDGHTVDTTQVVHDPDTDLALVKIAERDAVNLTAATFADSDFARVLQTVFAIGAPFDLPDSATYGHISAVHRRPAINKYEDFIQTDTPINPGSSGGPLFDTDGKIIGIVSAVRSKTGTFSGVGFAIASNLAKIVGDSLNRYGSVPRGYLGVRTAALTATEKRQYGVTSGVKVIELPVGDAPSRRAGLQVGDIILKIAGREVTDPQDLVFKAAHFLANHSVALYVLRNGQPTSLSAELWPLTPTTWPVPQTQRVAALGIWGEPISEQVGRRYGFTAGQVPAKGFTITDIEKGSLAETAGLHVGTVITEVERVAVGTAAEVQAQLTETRLTNGALLTIADATGHTSFGLVRK